MRHRGLPLAITLAALGGCAAESEDLGGGFIKPPHFVDAFPRHDEQLSQPPNEILVNFNFDLHPTLTMVRVRRDDEVVHTTGMVSADKLSLRVDLGTAPQGAGVWTVGLDACWPDGSCHPGQLVFRVDPSLISSYEDRTADEEVTVRMSQLAFDPPKLIVKAGTKVTWVNDEEPEHFVNSDPHPSHNVLPDLNSRALPKGGQFSYVFDRPGEWGYHCSAHTSMVAKVLVQP